MLWSKAYSPVIYQKIKVSTDLYGVLCRVYYPERIPNQIISFGDIIYSLNTFIESKLLIPKSVLFRNTNSFSEIGFFGDAVFIWSVLKIPKYSKVIIVENIDLLSFTITEIEATEDIRDKGIYFRYTLVPSTTVTINEELEISSNISLDQELLADPEFSQSIKELNITPSNMPSKNIKVGKL